MEGRAPLSGIMAGPAGSPRARAHLGPLTAAASAATGGGGGQGPAHGNSSTDGGPTLSPLEGRGLPVPHEQARERFTADWGGPFTTSIGRFTDQASQIYIRGGGSSNYMLHANGQLRIVTPTDPTMPFIGVMNLFDKNLSSGGILGLELTGDRSRVDRAGRPTHFDAATSIELNSGIFTNSDFTGTVDIRYRADGTAAVKVRGRVYTIGTTNPLLRSG